MAKADKGRVCELLRRLEEVLEQEPEVPARDMALYHVRRAMELAMCTPKHPVMGDKERELLRRGIVVE